MKKSCLILFFVPTMLVGQDVFNKTITIEPQMYTQNYEHFKRLVLDSPDSEAEYIDGFDFEWGYSYTLSVKVKDIGQLSDGTRYDYVLLSVKSKVKVPDSVTFMMSVDPLRYYDKIQDDDLANYTLNQLSDSIYLYMDQVEIEVPDDLQESFQKMIDNEVDFRGSFKFVTGRRIRLVRFR